MSLYIAQLVGTEPLDEPIIATSHTANYAIEKLRCKLRKRLDQRTSSQINSITEDKMVPEKLIYSSFDRDSCALLYGSDDLRPLIKIYLPHPYA